MAAAFKSSMLTSLNNNIGELYYRRKKVGGLKLTYDEYLNTFVPFEVREAFQTAAPWTMPDARMHRWELRPPNGEVINATLRMQWRHKGPHPLPVVRMLMIQGDAPKEIVSRIYEWATLGGDASREFGRVQRVLYLLNADFSRVAIRYYWPTILAIASENDKTREIVHELQDLQVPAKLKPLPPGLLQACRLAAETIATARLIPADIEDSEDGDVIIDIVSGQTYDEPFGGFCGLT